MLTVSFCADSLCKLMFSPCINALPRIFCSHIQEIPEEYGGSGMNFTSACLVVEELSRVDPSVSIMVDIHNTLTNNAVRFWGSEELKKKWLPRLASDAVSSFALSEAGSGTDAFALKTTATESPDGSYYTLNGEKLWISNSREAGVFLLFANVDHSLKHKGITAFMVDANTEGLHVGKAEKKLGLRASSTCPVVLDDVKVDAADILGEVGLGYKYCINILNEGRIGIASQQIGIAKGCMDIAMPYLNDRSQFGTKLADFQGMEHQYAQIATEIHAAEIMTYNTCRMKENDIPFVKEASMAKLYSSQVAEKAASKSIEWLGGIGFTQVSYACSSIGVPLFFLQECVDSLSSYIYCLFVNIFTRTCLLRSSIEIAKLVVYMRVHQTFSFRLLQRGSKMSTVDLIDTSR